MRIFDISKNQTHAAAQADVIALASVIGIIAATVPQTVTCDDGTQK
jgi:hypothetical protein